MPAAAERDDRRTVVIAAPPTTNGDLHVGHLAGPYVGADVHVRYLRSVGRDAVLTSCSDDYQTFVVTTAARRGTTPQALVTESAAAIQETFATMGVDLDGFAPTDEGYRARLYDHVGRLHQAGEFELRTVVLPYSESRGEYLVEGYVGGDCPTCLADSRGGACEACGHPIDFGRLLEPYSIMDPSDPVTWRDAEILVFPLEKYRDRLAAYYADRPTSWRPHAMTLMREILSHPLPDYPVTYPISYGWPAPFPETPGQTLNAWLDGIPASMYCTAWADRQLGAEPPSDDDAWRAERDARLVCFMGYDPLFVWGIVHVAELMAHGDRYGLWDTLLVNEFYELENEKFSSSKGHLIWARDLVAEVPRDVVRFYLCLSAPEHARTNFGRAVLDKVADERLVTPWNELCSALAKLDVEVGETGPLPVSASARAQAAAVVARFSACYELDTFSLFRAADLIAVNVERLRHRALAALAAAPDERRARLGDLFLVLRALLAAAAPVLIDLADAARQAGAADGLAPGAFEVAETTAFAVPRLSLHATPTDPTSA